MAGFDRKVVRRWVRGHQAAAEHSWTILPPAEAIRLSLSLIEAAWPVASNELNRKLHEESAAPVRAIWRKLAERTGRLPRARRSRKRSSR